MIIIHCRRYSQNYDIINYRVGVQEMSRVYMNIIWGKATFQRQSESTVIIESKQRTTKKENIMSQGLQRPPTMDNCWHTQKLPKGRRI